MIDFTPLIEVVLTLAGAVLTGVASWALHKWGFSKKTEAGEKMNAIINEAIELGLGYANQKLVSKGKRLTVSVENEFVEEATNYAVTGAAGALKKLGLTEQRVREMVEARLAGKVPQDDPEEAKE